MTKTILVSGSTGFIGSYLSELLVNHGYNVISLSRNPSHGEISYDDIDRRSYYAVIHLAGENIFSLWTSQQKKRIWNSRVALTQKIADKLRETPPKIFLSASAVGYYGDGGEKKMTEDHDKGSGFLSDLCESWEDAAASLNRATVSHLRFGMVLGKKGGALKKLLPSIKLGLGAILGSGKQFISWISIEDLGRAILHLLENPIPGPINFTSPHPIRQKEFMKMVAHHFHRPSFLRIPSFLLHLLPGNMGKEVFLVSSNVIPKRLIDAGFTFHHPTLGEYLDAMEK